jgi:DNA-binding CsgD family transcriptional regulator
VAVLQFQFLELVEGLTHLDPVRTYPQRGAALVAGLVGATRFELDLSSAERPAIDVDAARLQEVPFELAHGTVSLPLRCGRRLLGTLHLHTPEPEGRFGSEELRLARWCARLLARQLSYSQRLTDDSRRRGAEGVSDALARAPLTPREKDVVALLVAGSSTRTIAARTGLTVATVHTYLKRIYPKLGVHSRVELVARMAGTERARRGRSDEPLPS